MEKHLILGFLGKNLKGHPRLSDDVIAQFIRGNVPLGYGTVLTGINGVFERNCAKVVLAQRDAGLGVKLTVTLTKQKFETYLRFARDGRPLNDELKIIPQADDLQIIGGDSSLSARMLCDRYIIDNSDLLYYSVSAQESDFRGRYISYYLAQNHPLKNVCDLSERSARAFIAKEASLRYIRFHDMAVSSREIDNIYLRDWLAPAPEQLKKYFKNPEVTALHLLRDEGACDPKLLPLRVFFYVFSNSLLGRIATQHRYWQNSWAFFKDYQEILRIIRLARANDIEIQDFNIFDFLRYKSILREILQSPDKK